MSTLTPFLADWLDSDVLDDCPKHASFPACIGPPGLAVESNPYCTNCQRKASHLTYGRGQMTEDLDQKYRLQLMLLRELQYLVHRLAADAREPEGIQSGFLINGCGNLNFTWTIGWTVISVSTNTVTLQPSGDPRYQGIGLSRYQDETGIQWIYHNDSGLGIQPNDLLTFSAPSALYGKMFARVRKLMACSDTQVTVELDHDVSNAMWSTSLTEAEPTIYATTYRQSNPLEAWLAIITNSYRYCSRKSLTVLSLPEDGLVELTDNENNPCAIAWPEAAVPATLRPPTMKVYKTTVEGGRQDISATAYDYIYMVKTGDGDDLRGTWQTFLACGALDPGSNPITPLIDPETETLTRLEITYMPEATIRDLANSNQYRIPCTKRCKWSCRDHSDSVLGAPDGVATDANGETWFCRVRRYPVVTVVTDPETGYQTEDISWYAPTGIANYMPDCSQWGTCDQFAMLDTAAQGERPFTIWNDLSRFVRELVCSVNLRYTMASPGLASYRNITLCRIKHPSIMSLHGDKSLETPVGWHEKNWFPDWGCGYVAEVIESTDGEGNTTFANRKGFANNTTQLSSDLSFDETPDSAFASSVAGWTVKPDPFGVTYDSTTDPLEQIRRHFYRSGYRIERDTGSTSSSRNIADYTHVLANPETLYCPAVATTGTPDEWQDRGDMRYKYLGTPIEIDGVLYGAILDITPVLTTGKSPLLKLTGTIASATAGSGVVTIEFENAQHFWSYLRTVGGGESWDEIVSFYAGGSTVQAYNGYKVNSYYETDKTIGGTSDLLAPGDSILIHATIADHPDFEIWLHVAKSSKAHGGSQASGWGPDQITRWYTSSGYFAAAAANLDIPGSDYTGAIESCTSYVNASNEPGGQYNSSATVIKVSSTNIVTDEWTSFPVGSVVRATWTNELLRVESLDPVNHTITFTRGVGGSTPDVLVNYAPLVLEMVCRRDTGYEDEPLTRLTGIDRPASISTGEYWVDEPLGRIYFSSDDLGNKLRIAYHVDPNPMTPAYGFLEDWIVGGANPTRGGDLDGYDDNLPTNGAYIRTNLAYDDYYLNTMRVWVDGLYVTDCPGSPMPGEYCILEDGADQLVFEVNLQDAGKSIRIEIETGTTAVSPGDVADVPEYGTVQEYGRNQDIAVIADPSGVLAANTGSLVGTTVDVYHRGAVADPASTPVIAVAERYQDTWTTVTSLTRHGVIDEDDGTAYCRNYIRAADLTTLPTNTCWRAN
jgi:hypothetical protein